MVTGEGELLGWHNFQRLKAGSRVVADHTRIRRGSTSKLAKKMTFLFELTSSGQAVSAVVAITARPQFWCRMTPLPTQSSFSPAARIIRGSPRKTPCRHRKSLGRMSSRYFRQDFISLVRQAIWRVQRRTSLLHQQFSLKVLHQRIHRIVRYLQRIACIFDPQ